MTPAEETSILCCPVTRESLRPMSGDELDVLNTAITQGQLQHAGSGDVRQTADQALINASGTFAYLVIDGIYFLTASLAVRPPGCPVDDTLELRSEKEKVRQFYNEIGWKRDKKGLFEDTSASVDTRAVSQEYLEKCHVRLKQHLPAAGRYFLDVASGPVAHDTHISYSAGYSKRVCVDLSVLALQEARKRLGDHGVYVVGDLTSLPIADRAIDTAVSLHTIYHIPADEQRLAFDELHRVISDEGVAVVVYTFGTHAPLSMALNLPRCVARLVRRLVTKPSPPDKQAQGAVLYYHPHKYGWFQRQEWPYPIDIRCWRSLGKEHLELWFHSWLGGRWLLGAVYRIESAMPKLMGRIGRYPVISIHK